MTVHQLPRRAKSPHGLTPAFRQERKHQPWTNGRVWFGLAHIPKPLPIEGDAARLQAALLDPRTQSRKSTFQRIGLWLKGAMS